jgi:hypothetical protein
VFIALLMTMLILPSVLLFSRSLMFAWPSSLPAFGAARCLYEGGWQLGMLAVTQLDCLGGKNLHSCAAGGTDMTALVGHGLFLMIP